MRKGVAQSVVRAALGNAVGYAEGMPGGDGAVGDSRLV